VVVGSLGGQYPRKAKLIFLPNDEARSHVRVETSDVTLSQLLLAALEKVKTEHETSRSRIPEFLERFKQNFPSLASKYLKSDSLEDLLFKEDYSHVTRNSRGPDLIPSDEDEDEDEDEESCQFCDKTMIVERKQREMRVHYGLIASTSQKIKSAPLRDKLSRNFGGEVLCIEMDIIKAKPLFPSYFPCVVIRGICDYADSHLNEDWLEHAAIMATAYAKELLQYVSPGDVDREPSLKDVADQGK
jgi:hypothetical protein